MLAGGARRGGVLLAGAVASLAGAIAGCGRFHYDPIEARDEIDAGTPDCPTRGAGDATALAVYSFDDPAAIGADGAGTHDGAMIGSAWSPVPGPPGCGSALSITGVDTYLAIADDQAWQLTSGSLDVWLRLPPAVPEGYGLLGRDENGSNTAGHLSIFVAPDDRLVVRIQGLDSGRGGDVVLCSDPGLPHEAWIHIGLNVGPPASELTIDGVAVAGGGQTATPGDTSFSIPFDCGVDQPRGIDGNANPWVIGAYAGESAAGASTPVRSFAVGAAFDHLRIGPVRRDFSIPP